ncbi:MAG: hypothetical protein KDD33_01690 [Bdellovibrionales bacterium]|nr:hypothetical protein [Bdellovibrionales bacterium]
MINRNLKWALGLFALSILVSFLIIHPRIRQWARDNFLDKERKILSQLETAYGDTQVKILKISNWQGMFLEVYQLSSEGNFDLLDRAQLTDSKDAFYNFKDKKLNLFLKDVNEDGVAEILLPSMDKNMKPHINIYSFDLSSGKLNKISSH